METMKTAEQSLMDNLSAALADLRALREAATFSTDPSRYVELNNHIFTLSHMRANLRYDLGVRP